MLFVNKNSGEKGCLKLGVSETPFSTVNVPYFQEDEHVESRESRERDDVHEHEVHPRDVDGHVEVILAHGRGDEGGLVLALLGNELGRPADLEEPGNVVDDGERDEGQHGAFSPAVRANRSRLQRPTNNLKN